MEELLKVDNVWKSFKKRVVLKGVRASVKENEIVGLVGPNGAGKTTLIRISLGVLKRDKGSVLLMGSDPFKDPKSREGVGVVFERPSLPMKVPVIKVLEHVAKLKGASKDEINRAIKLSGLKGHEEKPFANLSAGLKRRAALAHALIGRPKLVIADEITSNLDPVERVKILDEIVTLKKEEGMSFFVSGHVLSEMLRIADKLVVISRGKVVAEGPPSDIVAGEATARIRTPQPELLARLLLESGNLNAKVEGVYVKVRISNIEEEKKLFSMLAYAVEEGIKVYNVDLIEAKLEEILLEEIS
jgi:ABC-2 type transport system ATP-binding protein